MRTALVLLLLACTASPALADAKPLTWVFVAKTENEQGQAATHTSKEYPTAGRCEDAKNDWLRKQSGVTIVELGDCQPVTTVPARGQ